MKKLLVNEDACIGCGSCVAVDPEHFDFNEDGLAKVVSSENLATNTVINAIGSCPTNAISIDEGIPSCDCSNCPGCASMHMEQSCSCDSDCECDSSCDCGCQD